jgi:nucleoside-diphosphate-sugar epimerase
MQEWHHMDILFIGGSGNISSAVTRMGVARGMNITLLNRGTSPRRGDLPDVETIACDIRDREAAARCLAGRTFDAVVDWIAFTPADIETDVALFANRTRQFVFISSASAYQKPPVHPLITESTPLCNPHWEYSRNKIACEEALLKAYRETGFPAVIVRPSHTYDTVVPVSVGNWNFTIPDRMLRDKPIIVHGDGTSLWTMTHADDFAKGFLGLLANPLTTGHAFHITSDEALSWNQIYRSIGAAVGKEPRLVHIPSDFIARIDPGTGANLLGDKAHSAIFDNSKIKLFVPGFTATIPFHEGIKRSIAWFMEDESRRAVDTASDAMMDRIIKEYGHC